MSITKVTVFNHEFVDAINGYPKIAPSKRTAENIAFLKHTIIEGTAETVDASLLDDLGRFFPPNQRMK